MTRFDAPDAVHRHGPYVIRRAQPSDALAYCRADARFVADTYTTIMPPAFAVDRLAEAEGLAPGLADRIAANLAAEAAGDEPRDRTWIALDGDQIVATCISSARAQDWESINNVVPIPDVSHQLNHLYLDRSAQGTGLAHTLMALALPGEMPAYLWIVGGNDRAWKFYERYRFVGDGITYGCGPIWFHRPLLRMYRTAQDHPADDQARA
jgi:GNAT superfamily N-acetyltransferase